MNFEPSVIGAIIHRLELETRGEQMRRHDVGEVAYLEQRDS